MTIRPSAASEYSALPRRPLVIGAAWAVPTIALATAAPAIAASGPLACQGIRRLVFADPGVNDSSGAVATNLLSLTYGSMPTTIVTDSVGATWAVTTVNVTITNISTSLITDLVWPLPYLAIAYKNQVNYHPMQWDTTQGLWLSDWLTSTSNPLYSNPLEPNSQYAAGAYSANSSAPLARESWSLFAAYAASSFYWSVTNSYSTITNADSIAVAYPASTSLAAGATTTISYSIWREAQSGSYAAYYFPDFLIGTVCV